MVLSFPKKPDAYIIKRAEDPPEYLGITHRQKELRGEFPHLTIAQAWVMAAVEINPGRNDDAKFIGWDNKNRPIFQRTEYGLTRFSAQTKSGDPTDPMPPFNLTPEARQEGVTL